MGVLTTRLKLYLAGGGSTSIGGPDEAADIDKQNGNFQKLDAALGAPNYTSSTRPATPFAGQVISETDTGQVMVFDSTRGSGEWVPIDRTWRQQTTPSGTRRVGDQWVSW